MNSQLETTRERPKLSRLAALFMMLACMAWSAQSTSAATDNSANFDIVSSTLVSESCTPGNGAFDPGETETVTFVIKKTTDGSLSNVKVSLVADASAGVIFVSGQQVAGDMGKDATASVTFSFLNKVPCTSQLNLTLRITSGANDAPVPQGDLIFGPFLNGTIVDTPHVFSNPASIEIKDSFAPPTTGSPYPSTIAVSGVSGTVSRVTVTLKNLSHQTGSDIDILLVGPAGQVGKVISDSSLAPVSNATITLDNNASASLPIESSTDSIVSGTFQPADYGSTLDVFPPNSTTVGSDLRFAGLNPNGNWQLFVVDDNTGGAGVIAGGWDLNVITSARTCCVSGLPTIAADNIGTPIPDRIDPGISEDPGDVVVNFFVDAVDFPANQLTVAGFSSDQSIIPDANLKVTGTDNNRTLTFKPAANANGTVTITLRVTAPNGNTATDQFQVKINPVNDPPDLTPPGNQAQNVGVATAPLPFTVNDNESGPDVVVMTGTSSNPAVVPNSNIFFGGAGANRTIQLVPVAGVPQSTTITLTATDPNGASTSKIFDVSFSTNPGFPTINPISDLTIEEDKTATVGVFVGDAETAPQNLTVVATFTAAPSDLITLGLGGSGGSRTLTITPKANTSGTALVTVTVTDGNGNSSNDQFTVTVTAVNDKPIISAIPPFSVLEDSSSGDIGFTVSDVEDGGNVSVTATSANPTLIPNSPANISLPAPPLGAITRTIKVTPAPDQFGSAVITVTATDTGGTNDATAVTVTVTPVNDPPTFVGLFPSFDPATGIGTGTPIGNDAASAFHLPEDAAETSVFATGILPGPNEVGQGLTVTATSDNPAILPNPTIEYTSPSAVARLKMKPVKDANGTVTLTVTVTDNGGTANGGNNTVSKSFKITVDPVNDCPTLSDVPTTNAGLGETVTIPITVGDLETPVANLVIDAVSSDPALVPQIVKSGAGASRLITLQVRDTTGGTAVITYTVRDDSTGGPIAPCTTTKTFTLNVSNTPPNKSPTIAITSSTDVKQDEDTLISVNVTVADTESPVNSLVVTGQSDNQAIISNVNIVDATGTGANRNVVIVPNKDANGVVNVTLTVTDTGDVNGFNKRAGTASMKITLNPIEDQPVATLTGSTTINTLEDKPTTEASNGSDTTSNLLEFTARDAETSTTNLTFQVTSGNTDVIPVANVAISNPTGTDGTRRTLIITPAVNRSGAGIPVTIRVVDQAGLSAAIDLTVNVAAVNDNPTLDQPADLSLTEVSAPTGRNLTLTGITKGAPDEAGQVLTITATSDNVNLITGPSVGGVGADGKATLSFTQNANISGRAKITLTATDDGGTVNGGANQIKREFFVTVGEVNQAPTISLIPDQAILQGSSSQIIGFSVADSPGETPAANLIVTATSSNEALLPAAGIALGGSGTSRSIRLTPNPTQFGTATVTVSVTDTGNSSGADVKSASRTFLVTVNQVQQNPVVSVIPDITTLVNTESDIVSFTVSDQETPAANLVVSAITSTNPLLIPLQNVQFGGSGGNRLLIVIPTQDLSGQSTVTIRVTDADSPTPHFTDRSFKVTVARVNTDPTITSIANVTIEQNSNTGPLAFTVGDAETAAGLLEVTAASSNQTLVPDANILLPFTSSTRGDRTVIVTPVPNQQGTAQITLTVKDSGSPPGTAANAKTASTAFTVTVSGGTTNTPPTISENIAAVITEKNTPTPVIPFTVDDAETAKGFLVVTAQSSNPTLIPVGNIFFGGSAGNRTVFITPAFDQLGTATITLTVTDAGSLTDSTSFQVTVFEETPAPPAIDVNGDGKPDLLFQDAGAFIAFWSMDDENLATAGLFSPNNSGSPDWRIVSSGNFNGDTKPDLLFQHTSGDLAVWYMNGISLTSPTLLNPSNPGAGWKAIAAGDFNGDGKSDILLQHDDGTLAVWYMNGADLTSPTLVSPPNPGAEWDAVAVRDFNSDGNPDIVFQDNLGTLAAWYMNGVDLSSGTLLNPPGGDPTWRVVASTDLNGDDNSDLVFQNTTDGRLGAWFMNGVDLIRATLLNPASPGGTWQVVGP